MLVSHIFVHIIHYNKSYISWYRIYNSSTSSITLALTFLFALNLVKCVWGVCVRKRLFKHCKLLTKHMKDVVSCVISYFYIVLYLLLFTIIIGFSVNTSMHRLSDPYEWTNYMLASQISCCGNQSACDINEVCSVNMDARYYRTSVSCDIME